MCRILGVIGTNNVVPLVATGLYNQVYAGEHSTGIAALTQDGVHLKKDPGNAVEVFPEYPDFSSRVAIGHNGCEASVLQPIDLSGSGRQLAIAVDATRDTTTIITSFLSKSRDVIVSVKQALIEINDPFALVVLSGDHGLIAARNSGIKPLTIGQIEIDGLSGFYVASQSGVLLEGTFLDTIVPGSLRVINQNAHEEMLVLDRADPRHCVNEVLFKQRPGNLCGKREVNATRLDIGERLGKRFVQYLASPGANAAQEYMAIAIPEGGRQFCIGFGRASGIEANPAGAVKAIYPVTAQMKEIARVIGLPENFALAPSADVAGRRIVLIDDQIRSGDKIAHVAKQCLALGAIEVIAAVGSIGTSSCPYGDAAYNGEDLIDRRHSLAKISQLLGVSAIITLPLEELIQAIGTPERIYCVNCLC